MNKKSHWRLRLKTPGVSAEESVTLLCTPARYRQYKDLFLEKGFSFSPTLVQVILFLTWHLLISPLLCLLILLFLLQLLLLAEMDSQWLHITPSVGFSNTGMWFSHSFPPRLLAHTPEIYAVSWGQPEFILHCRLEEQLEVGKTVTNVQALPNQSRAHDRHRL